MTYVLENSLDVLDLGVIKLKLGRLVLQLLLDSREDKLANLLIEDQLHFDTLESVQSEYYIFTLIFKFTDANVVSEPEPDVSKVIHRERCASHVDVLHILILSHDFDDAVEVGQIIATYIQDLEALVVHEGLLDEVNRLVDALDVDEGQLSELVHALAVHDQVLDAFLIQVDVLDMDDSQVNFICFFLESVGEGNALRLDVHVLENELLEALLVLNHEFGDEVECVELHVRERDLSHVIIGVIIVSNILVVVGGFSCFW